MNSKLDVKINGMILLALLYAVGAAAQVNLTSVGSIDNAAWQPIVLSDTKRTPQSAVIHYQNVTRVVPDALDSAGTRVLRMEVSAREADRLHGAMMAPLPAPLPRLDDTCLARFIVIEYEASFKVETDTRRVAFAPGLTCNLLLGSDWSTRFNMSGLAYMFVGGGNRTNVTNPEIDPYFPMALTAPVSMTQTCDTTAKSICPQAPQPTKAQIRDIRFVGRAETTIYRSDGIITPFGFRIKNGTSIVVQFNQPYFSAQYPTFRFKFPGWNWLNLDGLAPAPNIFFSSLFTNLTIYSVNVSYTDIVCRSPNANASTETTTSASTLQTNVTEPTTTVDTTTTATTTVAAVESATTTSPSSENIVVDKSPASDDTTFGIVAAGVVGFLLLCFGLSVCMARRYGPHSPTFLRIYASTPLKQVLCIGCRGPMEADDLRIERMGSEMEIGSMSTPTTSAESMLERAKRVRESQTQRQSSRAPVEYGQLPPPLNGGDTGLTQGYSAIPLDDSTAGALPKTSRVSGHERRKNQKALAGAVGGSGQVKQYDAVKSPGAREGVYDVVKTYPIVGGYDRVDNEDILDVSSESGADASSSGSRPAPKTKSIYDSPMAKLN